MSDLDDAHWVRWHTGYDDPGSSIARRLAVVQRRLGQALDDARAGSVRVVSMCAGQGRDVIGVLAAHGRSEQVAAWLVERDPALLASARAMAERAGLGGIEFLQADAGWTSSYLTMVPADVVLVCGVFGNIVEADIRATIEELPRLCAPAATVIWTRHRLTPDMTPTIRGWFEDAGFAEIGFDTEEPLAFAVGTHRLVAAPGQFRPERRMFAFVGDGRDATQ